MADENDSRVSQEAFDRVKAERDAAAAKVEELAATVKDLAYRDKARAYMVEHGVTNADWAADLVLPHLRGVEIDKIGEMLDSERFKPLVVQPQANADQNEEPPSEPASSGFSGPSPGSPGATPPAPAKIDPRSKEFKEAIMSNDRAKLAQWEEQDRVAWDPRVLAEP